MQKTLPPPTPVRAAATDAKTPAKGVEMPKPTGEPVEVFQARERLAGLQAQLAANTKEIQARNVEQQRMQREMDDIQTRINQLPLREQEMARITRDYDISKGNYQSLLGRKMAAEMTTDMERRQKSERFTILDPARPPLGPLRPNRKMLRVAALGVGALIGLALAFALELRRGVLLGDWELPPNTTVLGRLPRIKISEPRRSRGIKAVLQTGMSLLCVTVWLALRS
jgi:hypothetical protein